MLLVSLSFVLIYASLAVDSRIIVVIRCTTIDPDTDKPCRGKYCKPCMTNRYGQDIESIKASSLGKPETKLDYTFE
jgi:hypothetical protein